MRTDKRYSLSMTQRRGGHTHRERDSLQTLRVILSLHFTVASQPSSDDVNMGGWRCCHSNSVMGEFVTLIDSWTIFMSLSTHVMLKKKIKSLTCYLSTAH